MSFHYIPVLDDDVSKWFEADDIAGTDADIMARRAIAEYVAGYIQNALRDSYFYGSRNMGEWIEGARVTLLFDRDTPVEHKEAAGNLDDEVLASLIEHFVWNYPDVQFLVVD